MQRPNPSRRTTVSSRADNSSYNNDYSMADVNVYKRLQRDEVLSSIISFRVPVEVKVIYNNLTLSDRRLLRDIIINIIKEFAGVKKGERQNININVNVNQIQQKVEVRVEEKLLSYLERLYALRDPLPPLQRELVEKAYREAKRLLVP